MPFTVRVRENAHDMDESEAYDHGTFATYAEAEAARWKAGDPQLFLHPRGAGCGECDAARRRVPAPGAMV